MLEHKYTNEVIEFLKGSDFLSKWYRLDNAAKIFPPSRSKNDYKVFRFSVTLLEPVKVDILNKALDETLEEYPIFKSSLKREYSGII